MAETQRTQSLAQRCAEVAFEQYAAGKRAACVRLAAAALILQPGYPKRRGLISMAARALIGARAVDWVRRLRPGIQPTATTDATFVARTAADPTSPAQHADLAQHLAESGRLIEAYACWRTALSLIRLQGGADADMHRMVIDAQARLGINVNNDGSLARLCAVGDPYQRMQFLAQQIAAAGETPESWVLDVGGGNGFMSVLLPHANYVLIEPVVNGLSGLDAPFADKSFDVVLLVHSLEHVETERREALLHETIRLARRAVLILGPWAPAQDRPRTEEAILQATNTAWAREHLVYGLPVLRDTLASFDRQALRYDVAPHADARVMYWQYLATHFADDAGETAAVVDATAFFQRYFDYRPANPAEPHDFLVTVWVA